MKMVKSLLLGAAAGMVAVAGAQAADLPVKAKPVQYVKICSLYGAGFYYMPGTDTCIKIGGWVRAEMNFNAGASFSVLGNGKPVDLDSRALDFETTRVRAVATLDARSQTEYGTLRSYALIGEEVDNGPGSSDAKTYSNRMFIQWAGFTAGLASSFFDFYSTPKYSNTTNVLGSDTGGAGDTVFAYTAQFGGGFSATISAEDTSVRRTDIVNAAGDNGYAGRQWPDIVANLRIDQAWGGAQIMGAVHQVRTEGDPLDTAEEFNDVGYAVGAGLKLNLPWAKGDSFTTQVAYSKGALTYVGGGLGGLNHANIFQVSHGTSTGVGPILDAVVTNGGSDLDLTEGWSVVAGADHHWNNQWKTSLYGTYGQIMYSDAASAAAFTAGGGVGTATDGDWAFWQIGSRTVWTPVKNLDLSVDVMYNHLDTAFANEGLEDQGWWQGMFRVQRNFYP